MKKKGFTLMELLVVISIIALLMSILMPSLSKVKEQAKKMVCMNNLKSITLASFLWSEDHDGWTVAAQWCYPNPVYSGSLANNEASISDYTATNREKNKKLYACPSAKSVTFLSWKDGNPNSAIPISEARMMGSNTKLTYGVNGWVTYYTRNETPGDRGEPHPSVPLYGPDMRYWYQHGKCKVVNIRRPGKTVYFTDCEMYAAGPTTFDPTISPTKVRYGGVAADGERGIRSRWHGINGTVNEGNPKTWYGKGNYAWVDGSVTTEPGDFEDNLDKPRRQRNWEVYFWRH